MVDLTEYYKELKQSIEKDPTKTVPLIEEVCGSLQKLLSENPEKATDRAILLGIALSHLMEMFIHEGISPMGSILLNGNTYGKGSSLLQV